jgi:hypothetical protein
MPYLLPRGYGRKATRCLHLKIPNQNDEIADSSVRIWPPGRSIQFAHVIRWQYSSQMVEARIVIVNFNAGENLHRCMVALLAQTKADFEVRIVDNASTDDSLRYVPGDDRFLSFMLGLMSALPLLAI